jgi:hypothetical protein
MPTLRWIAQPLVDALWTRPSHLIDRYYVAMNRLLAVGDPQSLRDAEGVAQLIQEWGVRDDAWESRWLDLRIQIQDRIRSLSNAELPHH